MADKRKPLEGITVIEMGSLIAGPFAGKILAEFGAEVIKVEPPGKGDPLRQWRHMHNGTSLWFRSQNRNKQSITLDLRHPDGQAIARQLIAGADVLLENFRPGSLEKWQLGWESLHELNPGLILVRLSGYGQTGPYRERPGFGSVGEAMGGIRYVTGTPGSPPVRCGISLGDSLAALYAVIGTLMAVRHREARGGTGQVVDVALYEAVYGLMEGLVPEFDVFGVTREPTGSALPGIAPSNTYRTADGRYVVVAGNGDSIFRRLMHAIGQPALADDPTLDDNPKRFSRREFLDGVIEAWTSQHSLDTVMAALDQAGVPAGPIYTAKEMIADPQFREREMILEVDLPGHGPAKFPGIMPKLSETPGELAWLGPDLGAHNDDVYLNRLRLSEHEYQRLRTAGVI